MKPENMSGSLALHGAVWWQRYRPDMRRRAFRRLPARELNGVRRGAIFRGSVTAGVVYSHCIPSTGLKRDGLAQGEARQCKLGAGCLAF